LGGNHDLIEKMIEFSFHCRLRAQLCAAPKGKCERLAQRSVFFEKAAQKRSVKINDPREQHCSAASQLGGAWSDEIECSAPPVWQAYFRFQ
jgi:hypothetical protein